MVKLGQRISTVLIAWASAWALAATISQAAVTDSVTVRSLQHANFGRLSINWAAPVRVLHKSEGQKLTLRFDRPFPVDLGPAIARLEAYLDGGGPGAAATDLTLILKPDVEPKFQIVDRKTVIIDFRRNATIETESIFDKVRVSTTKIRDGVRLDLDWPSATKFTVDRHQDNVDVTFDTKARIDADEIVRMNKTLKPWFDEVRQSAHRNGTLLAFYLKPMIVPAVHAKGPRRIAIDLIRNASKPAVRSSQIVIPARRPKFVPDQRQSAPDHGVPIPQRRPDPIPGYLLSDEAARADMTAAPNSPSQLLDLTFSFDGPVGAAVFLRAGYLWTVFDAPPASLSPRSTTTPRGELVATDNGTAIRFPLPSTTGINVAHDGQGQWHIRASADPTVPKEVPIVQVNETASLLAMAAPTGRIIRIIDPLVGDEIAVWPIRQAAVGHLTKRRFVDMELLATMQGLAWRPLSDRLVAKLIDDGLDFSSQDGLALSTWPDPDLSPTTKAAPEVVSPDNPSSLERRAAASPHQPPEHDAITVNSRTTDDEMSADGMRKPAEHDPGRSDQRSSLNDRSGDVPMSSSAFGLVHSGVDRALAAESRRIMRHAIMETPPEEKNNARLNLARLLVAERLGHEARTVLDMISEDNDEKIIASKQALLGAVAILSDHIGEAAALLLASTFDDDPEIGVWRAALMSANKDWESAASGWRAANDTLDRYPPSLKLRLGLMAIEAAIEAGDEPMIRKGFRRLKNMETSPYEDEHVLQMRALQAERNGDAEGAREILENLTDSRNQSLRNWARFRLGSISLNGNVESPENLKMLTQSLPLWRGHPNERAMLDALARRYRNAGEPRAALSIWNKLIELYPEARSDETITGARQATFVNAVTESKSIPLDPFEVYSIYLDFIDLLPDESDNRKIYRDLAQHLAKLDLLGEAAQMLQPLIERLDDPIERAEIGAKIARLFLDQDRADSALSILARTNPRTTSLPASLHQERQLTSAETLAELGRTEEALEQIKDLQTFPARRLRAKLAWAEQSWPRLINAVETVLADPKLPDPLSVTDQRLVLWLAIAQGQRGEKRELQDLRRQYADLMRSGPWGEAFAVATQFAEGANDVISALSDTEAQLAELRRFRETVKANP